MHWRLLVGVATVAGILASGDAGRGPHARGGDPTPVDLDGGAWLALERALAEQMEVHRPVVDGAQVVLAGARIDAAGAHVGSVTLGLEALGRGDSLRAVDRSAAARVDGHEVRIARSPGVTEWWRSLPSGLEQGVTIETRPEGGGELVLAMHAGEDVRLAMRGDSVVLADVHGEELATYGGLFVVDADGVRAPARLAVAGDRITLHVDDTAARYPLVIDPLLVTAQEADLTAADGAAGDQLGTGVTITADGTRALVGAPLDDDGGSSSGSVYVFVRSGTSWTLETKLRAADFQSGNYFGCSVSVSRDGTTALIGAYGDRRTAYNAGSAYVFVRTGSVWTQAAKLLASDGAYGDIFGYAVAISGDGTRALVGARGAVSYRGTAYVFARGGSVWTEEQALAPTMTTGSVDFGWSVALSSAGDRAVVGADGGGAAYVFALGPTGWTAEQRLTAAPLGNFGRSVAMSDDGSRVLVGADRYDPGGAGYVFVRSGTTWSQEAQLVAADGAMFDALGWSASLSGDGTLALLGARGDDGGSARLFARTGTSWTEQASLIASAGGASDQFGHSVALSADGTRALVGALNDSRVASLAGSAYVFTIAPAMADGAPCTSASTCTSGLCVDGVCCATECGGGASDCQACSAALTGGMNGVCGPLSAALAPTITCRAAAGPCDGAETCSPASTSCPEDILASATTVCRAADDACDRAELCTGTSTSCPLDVPAPMGTECRPATRACDQREVCSGTSHACPPDLAAPLGTMCRPSAGPCDVDDVCDGAGFDCRSDAVRPAGTVCAPGVGTCDPDDVCDGASTLCRPVFATAGTICAPSSGEPCDAPDVCTGSSAECVATFSSGNVCRAPAGPCDAVETCIGTSATCPPDTLLGPGTVCRAATGTCNPAESCDGTSATCPADVDECTDAGPVATDASTPDAATSDADGGMVPMSSAGCACRVSRRRDGVGLASMGLALAYVLLAWRRRCDA